MFDDLEKGLILASLFLHHRTLPYRTQELEKTVHVLYSLPLSRLSAAVPRGHYTLSLHLMSTSVDSRRRPNLWSYISFGSTPRRRSISLPTKNNDDPFEKTDRHSRGQSYGSVNLVDSIKDAWMTQSSRSRYLKTVGLVAFFVLVFFLLAPGERAKARDLIGSMITLNMLKERR